MSVRSGTLTVVIRMTSGDLVAELRGHQWVVRDAGGATVAWISPAGTVWSVSTLLGAADAGRYFTARDALDSLAQLRGAPSLE